MEELRNSPLGVFFVLIGLSASIAILIKGIEFLIDYLKGDYKHK